MFIDEIRARCFSPLAVLPRSPVNYRIRECGVGVGGLQFGFPMAARNSRKSVSRDDPCDTFDDSTLRLNSA
jgi:hypothetical protein